MNRSMLSVISLLALVSPEVAADRAPASPRRELQMEGALLPILKVAADEASRIGLPVEKYVIEILDDGDRVGVVFCPPDRRQPNANFIQLGGGNPRTYEIQIRKSDRKILVSDYSR